MQTKMSFTVFKCMKIAIALHSLDSESIFTVEYDSNYMQWSLVKNHKNGHFEEVLSQQDDLQHIYNFLWEQLDINTRILEK